MIIEMDQQGGHVHAQGHAVPLDQGGEAELKRRCYEGLSKLNAPPDEVLFVRLWELEQEPEETADAAAETGPGSAVMSTVMVPAAPTQPPTHPATPKAKAKKRH